MNILIVERDEAQAISLMFRDQSHTTYTVDDTDEAFDLADIYDYDLIVTELSLAHGSGLDLIDRLRAARITKPIIALSGASEHATKMAAFKAGADDFLTTPVHPEELLARADVAMRRANGLAHALVEVGPMSINLNNGDLSAGGSVVTLTGKERAILNALAMRLGKVVSKEALMHHLYGGMDEPEIKIIDVFVCKLRTKIRNVFPGAEVYVETVWGRGYRLTKTPPAPKVRKLVIDLDYSLLGVLAGKTESQSVFEMSESLQDRPSVIRPTIDRLVARKLIRIAERSPVRKYTLTDAGRRKAVEVAA